MGIRQEPILQLTMLYETFDLIMALYQEYCAEIVVNVTRPALQAMPELYRQVGISEEDFYWLFKTDLPM